MTQCFEKIPSTTALANDRSTGELAFTFPEVVEAIQLCTSNEIAVLGVEIFVTRNGEYYASGCSTYELQLTQKWPEVRRHQWTDYTRENNILAEESVRSNPSGDDHDYILTTSSWREFCEIQK
jgi:hypothetical protein